MEKERIITIVGIIIIVGCCISIFNNIKYGVGVSKDFSLNMKYYQAMASCKPVKVHIKEEDVTKEIIGKAEYTCGVVENGKRCNFLMSEMPKLSSVSIKLLKAVESGDITTDNEFETDMVWIQDTYSKYCK